MADFRGARQIKRALVLLQTWAWSRILVLSPQLGRHVELDPRALLSFVWLSYLERLVPSDLWRAEVPLPEEMNTLIGRRSMLLMWRSDISRDITLGMAFFYPLRIYHHLEMITIVRRDTRTFGYQPAGVDRRMMEVDDMTIGVLEGPPSSPTHGVRRLPSSEARRGSAPTPTYLGGRGQADSGHGGERGGGSSGRGHRYLGSYVPPDPFDHPDLDALTFSLGLTPSEWSRYIICPTDPFDSPNAYYVQPPLSVVRLSFDAPPPPGTTGSSVPHMFISHASSSDLDEHGDDPSDDVTLA
ncbi:hypothetical protein M9H77_03259 [Catharanthus roseus]|uniref:Uncharacterized protein n=1 Tax=Catharanthus roseus TaxID=4058 RepID=A0ACC0CB84_CATRO|nr:hypothetical protein M9H77_03259 [Catharanthus roseus]